MRFLKYVMFLTFFLVILVAVVGLFLPSSTHVARSIIISQKPNVVFSQINDLKTFSEWSPWSKKDPDMKLEFSTPSSGEGATMHWSSENPNVGVGSQTIVESVTNQSVKTDLDFGAMGYASAQFILKPQEGNTKVTWTLDVDHGQNLMSRYMGLMMDKWVGLDYEQGLESLKSRAESLAAITTEDVQYDLDGVTLNGYLAYPTGAENIPGVLVVHEWWGHNDYARSRAEQLAEMGYAAFALDMYGDGKLAEHPKDANAFMMEVVQDFNLLQGRFHAALDVFKSTPQTNPNEIAAIGYCFGGAVVLSMARSGVDLAGVASFHGSLGSLAPITDAGKNIPYLVMNGADDPFVKPEHKEQFKTDMDAAGVDYEFIDYPNAVHAFTNPGATAKGEAYGLPLAYNAQADADSWLRLERFLSSVFKP